MRITYQGGSNGAKGEASRRYITTVSKRLSVR